MDEIHSQMHKIWSPGYVYVIDYGDGKTFKIGYTKYSPEKRLKQIVGSSVIMPMYLVMSAKIETNAYFLENMIHMRLDAYHENGEWFKLEWDDLIKVYQMMSVFSNKFIKLYDRWFELYPEHYHQAYIDGKLGYMDNIPPFSKRLYDMIVDPKYTAEIL